LPKAKASKTDERDMPAALVEIESAKGAVGTWLVSPQVASPQEFSFEGRTYTLGMRFARDYYPFGIELVKFSHDTYQGTDIPRNFSSQIRLINPATGENRPVLIRMNEPLRHAGYTFYQASFDPNDPRVSVLQVVKNPGWLTPYISCVLVGWD
jgi:cytochrome c biogenesis protein ResB